MREYGKKFRFLLIKPTFFSSPEKKGYLPYSSNICKILFTFVQVLVWMLLFKEASMKREPGVNPGQTRCCELHEPKPILKVTIGNDGKTRPRGVSQKTCQNIVYSHSFRG